MYLSPTYLTYSVLITVSIYTFIPLPEDFCGVDHWVDQNSALTCAVTSEILCIASVTCWADAYERKHTPSSGTSFQFRGSRFTVQVFGFQKLGSSTSALLPKPLHPPLLNKQIMAFPVFMADPGCGPSTNGIYDVSRAFHRS